MERVKTSLYIDTDTLDKLKILAILNNTKVNDIITRLVEAYVSGSGLQVEVINNE